MTTRPPGEVDHRHELAVTKGTSTSAPVAGCTTSRSWAGPWSTRTTTPRAVDRRGPPRSRPDQLLVVPLVGGRRSPALRVGVEVHVHHQEHAAQGPRPPSGRRPMRKPRMVRPDWSRTEERVSGPAFAEVGAQRRPDGEPGCPGCSVRTSTLTSPRRPLGSPDPGHHQLGHAGHGFDHPLVEVPSGQRWVSAGDPCPRCRSASRDRPRAPRSRCGARSRCGRSGR